MKALCAHLVERVAPVADLIFGNCDLHDLISKGIDDVLVGGLACGVRFVRSLSVVFVLLILIVLFVVGTCLRGVCDAIALGLRKLREDGLDECSRLASKRAPQLSTYLDDEVQYMPKASDTNALSAEGWHEDVHFFEHCRVALRVVAGDSKDL